MERSNDYRSSTLRARHPGSSGFKTGAKGHDAVLKALQDSGRQATLVTLAGEEYVGKIVGRDKFTITLLTRGTTKGIMTDAAQRRVFYKHGLEQFYGEESSAPQAS